MEGRADLKAELPVVDLAGVPPDAFALIMERGRREGEIDRFQWFCPKCDAFLHEETAVVSDYAADHVSRAYQRFFDNEEARTCKARGTVMPRA